MHSIFTIVGIPAITHHWTTPSLSASEALKVRIPTELRGYAGAMPGSDPFERANGQSPVSLEEFFKELFSDFQDAQRQSKTALAYEQLLDVYVQVLRRTTDWMGEDKRRGAPIGQLLDCAASCSSTVKVLTFNHDLLIENERLGEKALEQALVHRAGLWLGQWSDELLETKYQPGVPSAQHHV